MTIISVAIISIVIITVAIIGIVIMCIAIINRPIVIISIVTNQLQGRTESFTFLASCCNEHNRFFKIIQKKNKLGA